MRGRTGGGYGRVRLRGEIYLAHRLAWHLAHGPISDGVLVLHGCPGQENPLCVNPAHLRAGTQRENMADRDTRGRHGMWLHPERRATGDRNGSRRYPERLRRGETSASSKVTAAQVAAMRRAYAAGGVRQWELGAVHGVSQAQVSRIVRGTNWQGDYRRRLKREESAG
jgi:hypothetical protein